MGSFSFSPQPAPFVPNQTFRMPTTGDNGNPALVKSSSGYVFTVTLRNTSGAERYLKLYNLNREPVIGTDIPFWTDFIDAQGDFYREFASPLFFNNGISMALTAGPGDQDTVFPAAGEIVALNISYK